jgi:hypothetical protein
MLAARTMQEGFVGQFPSAGHGQESLSVSIRRWVRGHAMVAYTPHIPGIAIHFYKAWQFDWARKRAAISQDACSFAVRHPVHPSDPTDLDSRQCEVQKL